MQPAFESTGITSLRNETELLAEFALLATRVAAVASGDNAMSNLYSNPATRFHPVSRRRLSNGSSTHRSRDSFSETRNRETSTAKEAARFAEPLHVVDERLEAVSRPGLGAGRLIANVIQRVGAAARTFGFVPNVLGRPEEV